MKLIGTYSKANYNITRFCTCIFDTETGLIEKHYQVAKTLPRQGRLHMEATITLQWLQVFPDAELHFDFSTNPKHKSYPVYLAYKGLGKLSRRLSWPRL